MLYHAIGDEERFFYAKGLYDIIPTNRFRNDMICLLDHYKPISLKQLLHYRRTGELPSAGKFFFLSFDDGLKETVKTALPVLMELGIPASFFINTDFVGNRNYLHRFKTNLLVAELEKDTSGLLIAEVKKFFNERGIVANNVINAIFNLKYPKEKTIDELILKVRPGILDQLNGIEPYLSLEDIKELLSKGFTIGAHSASHPEYALISFEEQLSQTIDSIRQIEEWFHPEYSIFAFPFTDVGVGQKFFTEIRERCHIDLSFGSSGIKKDRIRNHLNRIPMDDRGLDTQERLKFELVCYFLKSFLGKNTYRRK
jgi:peptidoglycan/xylan/chitin deacetylase (PgdA/CDA1 family)